MIKPTSFLVRALTKVAGMPTGKGGKYDWKKLVSKLPMTPILKSDCMELGTGNMNLNALLDKAKENGVDAVILESHKNWIDKSPIKSLEKSADFFKMYFSR